MKPVLSHWKRYTFLFILFFSIPFFFGTNADPLFADDFTVNSIVDAPDANPGDGVCATVGGECTLRAAVEETNQLQGSDTINLPAGVYDVNGRIHIQDHLTLVGEGADVSILDGENQHSLLWVETVEWLVCDASDDSVHSFDQFGQHNSTFVSNGSGGLDIPLAISIGDDSDVFVTGFSSGVHRYHADTGQHLGLFAAPGSGGLLGPTDGQFGPLGHPNRDLYVTKFQPGGGILRYDRFSGAFIEEFVAAGSGGLAFPNSIAFRNDDLFVTSVGTNNVLRYDGETGAFVDEFVTAFSGGLNEPRNLVFHEGSLYVASEANDSVLEYDADTGAFIGTFVTSGSGGLDEPNDIAFGIDGNFYVNSSTNQILRYDGDTGAFIDVFIDGNSDIFIDNPSCMMQRTNRGDGPIVNIRHLSLLNARDTSSTGTAAALVVSSGSSVTLSDAVVQNSNATIAGGAIRNAGNLTIRRTEVIDSSLPSGSGGGVTASGGGIYNTGNMTIDQSLIANNSAVRGGGISNFRKLDIINSTISGNTTNGGGAGIRNAGDDAVLNIVSSTITQNVSNQGGDSSGANFGGGILNIAGAQTSMAKTILAENEDGRSSFQAEYSPDCYSDEMFRFTSHRDNLVGILTDNCIFRDTIWGDTRFDEVGDSDNPLDPDLNPLTDNGGATRTHALQSNSVALDEANSGTSASFFDCRTVDQRGEPRPIDADIDGFAICDIGAYEYQPPSDGDGIVGFVEDGAPNDGDGNNDGIPDRLQPNVTSIPNAEDGRYVTLVTSEGSVVQFFVTSDDPSGGSAPAGVDFPVGHFQFEVTANPLVEVTLILPDDVMADSYYKYGPTPSDNSDHWYQFDGLGNPGASVFGNTVTLRFVDGEIGDSDLSVNGIITDPGGPGAPFTCGGQLVTILGTNGNDRITGTAGVDVIHGLDGNDIIRGLEGDDIICGGDGDDFLKGDQDNDLMFGGDGNDRMAGWHGDDEMHGGLGDDFMLGRNGNDTMYGDGGNDTLNGMDGDDTIFGGDDDDKVIGENGNDTLHGESGNDKLLGMNGDDDLFGGVGDDQLLGGQGFDTLDGGGGNDILKPGPQ